MRCYNCGGQLSEYDFCTGCGVDVALYKKVMKVSNMYYNDGLAKAGVRDLTGAIVSLRQSLKFNKNNIEARNLLGLVYFETGEVVAALSEWVISKNMRQNKNIADDYIEMVQSNAARLEAINQTIKKYNQALVYCHQDSLDLAIIQLKKVLSLNPKFIRAHQLLALLYIHTEDWEKAKRELDKCKQIDMGNTQTLRYMKEVEKMLIPDETVKTKAVPKRGKEETVRYQSDNEIIIQPMNVKEPKMTGGVSTLFNIGIGIALGVLATYFLIRPAILQTGQSSLNAEIKTYGEQLDAKTSQIAELEQQISSLTDENTKLHEQVDSFVGTDGTLQTMDGLLDAAKTYIDGSGDIQTIATNLETISEGIVLEETSESFQNLYQALLAAIGPEVAKQYYSDGYNAYSSEDYDTAIENLKKAVFYDAANADALLSLGNAYRKKGDSDNAVLIYEQLIEQFPGTEKARKAGQYRDSLIPE